MNLIPKARGPATNAQETIQTTVVVLISAAAVWMLLRVPWQVSADPCLLAADATVVLFVLLWLTRWRGLRGANLERNLLTAFLVGMQLVYVARYLFASLSHEAGGHEAGLWLWVEVSSVPVFVGLAFLGVKRSAWFLAAGIALHGIAWDSWHYRSSTYMPDWYSILCMLADFALGAYVAVRVPAYDKASRGY